MIVNGKPMEEYVKRPTLAIQVREPLESASSLGTFDVRAQCLGGGLAGQAGALRHGLARALVVMDEGMRTVMRRHGFLTRDPRVKESKKYGRKRRSPRLPVQEALSTGPTLSRGPEAPPAPAPFPRPGPRGNSPPVWNT